MATTDLRAESAPHNLPFSPPAPAAVMRVLSRYDRRRLAAFVSVAIDLMDLMDGDPDLEDNNDREWIDEREGLTDEDQNIVAPVWPGEGTSSLKGRA